MTSSESASPDAAVVPRNELSAVHLTAHTDAEVLTALAGKAEVAGWVSPGFTAALLERERAYPTGLPTSVPVAIPHADADLVIRSGLGVATLREPVSFGEMGGSGESVDARFVVLILVTDPRDQIELLTRLIGVFQKPDWFGTVEAATRVEDLVDAFAALLK